MHVTLFFTLESKPTMPSIEADTDADGLTTQVQ